MNTLDDLPNYVNRMISNPALEAVRKAQEAVAIKLAPIVNVKNALGIGNPVWEKASMFEDMLQKFRPMWEASNAFKRAFPPSIMDKLPKFNLEEKLGTSLFNSIAAQSKIISLAIPELPKWHSVVGNISSLQDALASVSAGITETLARHNRWEDISTFEEVSQNVALHLEERADTDVITKADLEELKTFLIQQVESINHKIDGIGKDFQTKLSFWITIISFIFSWPGYVAMFKEQPKAVTPQDITLLRKEILEAIDRKITPDNISPYHKVRKCNVYLKPRFNSHKFSTLSPDTEVRIIHMHHKWACVSFIDSRDGIMQTGWILKKCIVNP